MKNLCRAIIRTACFLELSEDNIVEPDSAVRALEDIAATLRSATAEEKAAFAATCAEEVARLERDAYPGQAKTAGFVRKLPDLLGLRV